VRKIQTVPRMAPSTRLVAATAGDLRPLLVLLAAGLVVRLALVAATSTSLQIIDERQYAQLAESLAQGHGYAFTPGHPTSMRPPLYSWFVAGIWTLTGSHSVSAVRLVQIALALLTTTAVYALGLRLFDRRAALIAAALTCFYPSLLFSGLLLLTEVLFTLLVVVFVLQYDSLLRRPRILVAASVGATLGLAAMTRSVLWPFPLVLLPLLFLSLEGRVSRRAWVVGCCLAGYVGVVGPWAVRNTYLQRTTTMVDTMGGMNLRMGNYQYTPEDRMWDAVSITGERNWSYGLRNIHPEAATWTDGQKDKWAQREAISYMLSNPAITIRRSILKFADFWGLEREMPAAFEQGMYRPPVWFMWLAIGAVLVSYPLVVLGGAVGIFTSTPSSRGTHALIISLIAFIAAVHSVVFGHSRYHLPLVPLLGVYAAAALAPSAIRAHVMARSRVAAAAIACGLLLLVWMHEVFFRDAEHVRALLQRLT